MGQNKGQPRCFQGGRQEVERKRTRRQQPLHINARIQTTIVTIVKSMVNVSFAMQH